MSNLPAMDMAGLIARCKGTRSYEQLAQARPGSPSRQWWQKMATGAQWWIEPPTIRAVADVLGVTERIVVLCLSRTMGLRVDVDGSALAALLPPAADRLSDEQVAAVLSVVKAMLGPVGPPMATEDGEDARDGTSLAEAIESGQTPEPSPRPLRPEP